MNKSNLGGIFFALIFFFSVFTISCSDSQPRSPTVQNSKDVLVYVNGEPIYQKDVVEAIERYNSNNSQISNSEALESAISEMLVLEQADVMGITVTDEEIDEAVLELQQSPLLYKIALEDYGSIEYYKSKLKLNIQYNQVMHHVISSYLESNPIGEKELLSLMVEYNFTTNYTSQASEELKSSFTSQYNQLRGNEYFADWIQTLRDTSTINYTPLAKNNAFIS